MHETNMPIKCRFYGTLLCFRCQSRHSCTAQRQRRSEEPSLRVQQLLMQFHSSVLSSDADVRSTSLTSANGSRPHAAVQPPCCSASPDCCAGRRKPRAPSQHMQHTNTPTLLRLNSGGSLLFKQDPPLLTLWSITPYSMLVVSSAVTWFKARNK